MTADSIVFVWRGTDRNGQPTAGEEMASSAAMARAQLRKQGVTRICTALGALEFDALDGWALLQDQAPEPKAQQGQLV